MTAASYVRILGANDRIGIGVIGFGLIGKQHITDLKKFKDVEYAGHVRCLQAATGGGTRVYGKSQRQGLQRFPEDV